MKRADLQQIAAYSMVGLLSVSAAFLISTQLLGRSHAQTDEQNAPPSQEQAPPPANGHPTPGDVSTTGPKIPGDISELEGFLEPFIYDIVNRRDPFQAWAEYVPSDGPSKPLSPAQRFDLDQLNLVGIMWDVKDPKAMFTDPDNEVIVLGRDEGIGNKNGYIAAIREGEVVVVEANRKRGELIYKTRTLRIER